MSSISGDAIMDLTDVSVLYVEDDPVSQAYVSNILLPHVGALYTAANGQEGLLAFAKHSPDILITDLLMPVLDGIELCREVLKLKPGTPIIVTTVVDEPDSLRRSLEAGVRHYAVKPVDGDELLATISGCTEAVRHERLQATQRRYHELMVAGLPGATLLVDREKRTILAANPTARELGLTPGAPAVGPFFPDTVFDVGVLAEELEEDRAYQRLPGVLERFSAVRKENVEVQDAVYDIHVIPVALGTLLIYAEDVSSRYAFERMRAEMEAIMHHDVRTPLTGILGLTRLLREEIPGPQALSYLEMIETSTRKALKMFARSLDLYRLEEAGPCPTAPAFDLTACVERIRQELTWLTRKREIQLRYEVIGGGSEEPFTVWGEETLIEAMLENLIKNGLEAAPRNSTLTVTARRLDEEARGEQDGQGRTVLKARPLIRIDVHNLGSVPLEVRKRFFEPLISGARRGTADGACNMEEFVGNTKGTGLGAYSARRIALAHGGDLTMKTDEERGTTLTATLPVPPPSSDS